MKIDEMIEGLLEREGAYSDNVNDPGGVTMWGWTEKAARQEGWVGRMRDMPREWAAAAYRRVYVQRPGFDKVMAVNSRIAEELVDTAVNCGVGLPGPWLQRCLNLLNRQGNDYADVAVDGLIGPATCAALSAFLKKRGVDGEKVLLRLLNGLQAYRYVQVAEANPRLEEFFYGWILNRVEV
jgi:lysozyme family protein